MCQGGNQSPLPRDDKTLPKVLRNQALSALTGLAYFAYFAAHLFQNLFLEKGGMIEKLECLKCPYIAPRIERLRSHIKVQHQGLRVACQLCPYTATESSNLNRHIASVHDNVRYECEHCQKVYTEKKA